MLYGTSDAEPQTDIIVAQLAQELYNTNLLLLLIQVSFYNKVYFILFNPCKDTDKTENELFTSTSHCFLHTDKIFIILLYQWPNKFMMSILYILLHYS